MTESKPDLPIFDGSSLHWLWADSEMMTYKHRETFVSEELYSECAQWTFSAERPPVVYTDFRKDNDEVPEEEVRKRLDEKLDRYANKPHQPVSRVRSLDLADELPQELTNVLPDLNEIQQREILAEGTAQAITSSSGRAYVSYNKYSRKSINQVSNYRKYERGQRRYESVLSDQASDDDYSGPIYVYETGSSGNLKAPTGPINVVWSGDITKDIGDELEALGWSDTAAPALPKLGRQSAQLSQDRSIITDANDGTGKQGVKAQDDHYYNHKSMVTGRQHHVRLYTVPDWMDTEYKMVGEVHIDPPLHGHIFNNIPLLTPNYRFNQCRDDLLHDWNPPHQSDQKDIGSIDVYKWQGVKLGYIDPP